MSERRISVAIDGPAGAGKSTMARQAAKLLGYVYVDTGAIYRTVGYAAYKKGIELTDRAAVAQLLPEIDLKMEWAPTGEQHMFLNGEDVSEKIRQPEISAAASMISAIPEVRQFLLETQRAVARERSVVMDGRDIGTVVLPDAEVKIFLSASAEVRAMRRWKELQAANRPDTYEEVLRDMNERDYRDIHREIAPLRPAEDAIELDTSSLNLEESIAEIIKIIRERTV